MSNDVLSTEASRKPVVAILTVEDDDNDFRGNRNNFADLVKTGAVMGIQVYVTTTRFLRLNNRKLVGYAYNPADKTWSRKWLPLPHVIYNRIPLRKDEQTMEAQKIIDECLKHPSIQIFNPAFFNKWSLFEWLSKSEATKPYIPETKKYNGNLDLHSMLRQHPLLYLKPERGKAGKGIMRVRRLHSIPFPFQLKIQNNKKSRVFKYARLDLLRAKLNQLIGSKEYIVQQGIRLVQNNGRPFDLRALVQKNRKGQWTVSGIGARVAGAKSITTHVPRGGSIDDPGRLLAAAFGRPAAARILRRARRASLHIARQIEKASGHMLGEMSMDLGVDRHARIWFFEANSKPMKFDEPHIRQKSLRHIMHYSAYLTKSKKYDHLL